MCSCSSSRRSPTAAVKYEYRIRSRVPDVSGRWRKRGDRAPRYLLIGYTVWGARKRSRSAYQLRRRGGRGFPVIRAAALLWLPPPPTTLPSPADRRDLACARATETDGVYSVRVFIYLFVDFFFKFFLPPPTTYCHHYRRPDRNRRGDKWVRVPSVFPSPSTTAAAVVSSSSSSPLAARQSPLPCTTRRVCVYLCVFSVLNQLPRVRVRRAAAAADLIVSSSSSSSAVSRHDRRVLRGRRESARAAPDRNAEPPLCGR